MQGTNQFTIESKIGRPNYLNLEALLEGKYSKKTDLWSLACLIFHLTTSEHLVQPPTGRNTFESCATVIREGYPLVGNGGHRTVETVYDRINRSKRGKLLRPLLQSSQEPENVIEIFLRETEAIVSGDNSANPSGKWNNWDCHVLIGTVINCIIFSCFDVKLVSKTEAGCTNASNN